MRDDSQRLVRAVVMEDHGRRFIAYVAEADDPPPFAPGESLDISEQCRNCGGHNLVAVAGSTDGWLYAARCGDFTLDGVEYPGCGTTWEVLDVEARCINC